MASTLLLPPLIDSAIPSKVTSNGRGSIRIYFSVNNVSNIDIGSLNIRIKIYRQDGVSVLNSKNKLILNDIYYGRHISYDANKQSYYVTLNSSSFDSVYIFSDEKKYTGFIPGWVYKIQIGLTPKANFTKKDFDLANWVRINSPRFSEWSTICYYKPIAPMVLKIPVFGYDSSKEVDAASSEKIYTIDDTNFAGTLRNQYIESKEEFKTIRLSLYDSNEELLKDSGYIYNTNQNVGYFDYDFRIDFERFEQYTLQIHYETDNGYTGEKKFNFKILDFKVKTPDKESVHTIESAGSEVDMSGTSFEDEEEEGRIGLKLYATDSTPRFENICIVRSSELDNYKYWEDIKIITLKNQSVNDLDMIYDYTVESGINYRYGIQCIDRKGRRSAIVSQGDQIKVKRVFEHSYLLGEGGVQLKLPFNTTLTNYKSQIYDSKTDSIGGKYPIITRNANVNYRIFSISTLVSYNMDEKNTFISADLGKEQFTREYDFLNDETCIDSEGKEHHHKMTEESPQFEDWTIKGYTGQNNDIIFDEYTYERLFREKVLDFLQDGKPKLFKSVTEGNIIVRITDVMSNPEKSLYRKIYNVNMSMNEIDDNTLKNYLKYGFYDPGFYSSSFETEKYYLGQVNGRFDTRDSTHEGSNIFELIYNKYDSKEENLAGIIKRLIEIKNVKITVNGYYYNSDGKEVFVPKYQMKIIPETEEGNSNECLGIKIYINSGHLDNQYINIFNSQGIYNFDSSIIFYYNKDIQDVLCFCGDSEEVVTAIDATIDFIYQLSMDYYEEPEEKTSIVNYNVGQIATTLQPGDSIFNLIYGKYYYNTPLMKRYLSSIDSLEIESNPGVTFKITDTRDTTAEGGELHTMNDTGTFVLNDIGGVKDLVYEKKEIVTPRTDWKIVPKWGIPYIALNVNPPNVAVSNYLYSDYYKGYLSSKNDDKIGLKVTEGERYRIKIKPYVWYDPNYIDTYHYPVNPPDYFADIYRGQTFGYEFFFLSGDSLIDQTTVIKNVYRWHFNTDENKKSFVYDHSYCHGPVILDSNITPVVDDKQGGFAAITIDDKLVCFPRKELIEARNRDKTSGICYKDSLEVIFEVPKEATQFSMNAGIYYIGRGGAYIGGNVYMNDSLAEKIKDLVTIEKIEGYEKPDAIITYTATVKTKIYEPAE